MDTQEKSFNSSLEELKVELERLLRKQIEELSLFSEKVSELHGKIDPATFFIAYSFSKIALDHATVTCKSLDETKQTSLLRKVCG